MSKKEPRPLPKSIKEAVDTLIKELPRHILFMLNGMEKKHLIELHLGSAERGMPYIGRDIRNNFQLWKNNEELKEDCKTSSPDEVSQIIVEALYGRVKDMEL